MSFILGLYCYHEKNNDKIIEKEMFIWGFYEVILLEINIHDFIEEIFKLVENKYKNLDKKM